MSTNIPYRRDIDGLRAIAVLSVILSHLDWKFLPGGFIGVDIFFAISGFLITGIIFRSHELKEFSFRDFYLRRVRRILPVFLVVIITTLVVGSVILLPDDRASLISSARYAVVFCANVFFAKERGYFDQSADELPLLHLWSLAVEEQFYMLWPAIFVLILAITRKKSSQLVVLPCVIALCVLGFIASELVIKHWGTSVGYYSTISRFGELLVGAVAVMARPSKSRKLNELLASVGAILLIVSFATISKGSHFPGWTSLLPTVGAGLIMYSGRQEHGMGTVVSRLLGLRALVLIGLISYSLYLWHWPILSFMRYVLGQYELPIAWIVVAVMLMFGLAFMTYRFIEVPARRSTFSLKRAFFVCSTVSVGVFFNTGLHASSETKTVTQAPELVSFGENVCHYSVGAGCIRGDASVAPRVLVVGDSHVAAYNYFFDVVGKHEG